MMTRDSGLLFWGPPCICHAIFRRWSGVAGGAGHSARRLWLVDRLRPQLLR